MTTVYRVRFTLSGFTGGPGYSTFSFQDLNTDTARNAAGAAIRVFFNGIAGNWLSTWTGAVDTLVSEHDMATGQLTGQSVMTTPPAAITGAMSATAYAGGSGAVISWKTGLIYAGRRVQGRTFCVPLVGVYETDGTLTSGALAVLRGSAAGLIADTATVFSVWHKTMTKPTDGTKPVQVGGAIAPADTYVVKDQASQLRSRR
jgi:hypothetical protein